MDFFLLSVGVSERFRLSVLSLTRDRREVSSRGVDEPNNTVAQTSVVNQDPVESGTFSQIRNILFRIRIRKKWKRGLIIKFLSNFKPVESENTLNILYKKYPVFLQYLKYTVPVCYRNLTLFVTYTLLVVFSEKQKMAAKDTSWLIFHLNEWLVFVISNMIKIIGVGSVNLKSHLWRE